jgi:dTDP-glucose 4,6-dehydratase
MTMAYRRAHGVDTRIVRIFNTYGPRMRPNDGRAVCTFITQALDDQDLTLFGDGSQTRSFCYVTDLVDGILKLFDSTEGDPVNIGNPDEIPVRKLAEEVIEMTGAKVKIVIKPLPQDDPKQRRPDITRARTILRWEPVVPRRQGLEKTIAYFKSLRG